MQNYFVQYAESLCLLVEGTCHDTCGFLTDGGGSCRYTAFCGDEPVHVKADVCAAEREILENALCALQCGNGDRRAAAFGDRESAAAQREQDILCTPRSLWKDGDVTVARGQFFCGGVDRLDAGTVVLSVQKNAAAQLKQLSHDGNPSDLFLRHKADGAGFESCQNGYGVDIVSVVADQQHYPKKADKGQRKQLPCVPYGDDKISGVGPKQRCQRR